MPMKPFTITLAPPMSIGSAITESISFDDQDRNLFAEGMIGNDLFQYRNQPAPVQRTSKQVEPMRRITSRPVR